MTSAGNAAKAAPTPRPATAMRTNSSHSCVARHEEEHEGAALDEGRHREHQADGGPAAVNDRATRPATRLPSENGSRIRPATTIDVPNPAPSASGAWARIGIEASSR